MNDVLREVAKAQREKAPFCERFIEFLQAGLDQEIIDSVNYNIIAWQERKEMLRTDRDFEYYNPQATKPLSKHRFESNEEAIMANKSDAQVLEQMAAFRAENSLDMDEEAQQWFDYITTGQIGAEVAKRLRG